LSQTVDRLLDWVLDGYRLKNKREKQMTKTKTKKKVTATMLSGKEIEKHLIFQNDEDLPEMIWDWAYHYGEDSDGWTLAACPTEDENLFRLCEYHNESGDACKHCWCDKWLASLINNEDDFRHVTNWRHLPDEDEE